MESTKRQLPTENEEPETKKPKVVVDDDNNDVSSNSSKPTENNQRVVLNPADCGLDFDIESDGCQGSGLHAQGFAYCWSGARANVGITGGKYCFSCKVISAQPVEMEDTAPDQQHLCRLGISKGDDPVGGLGESEQSFGFGGTGKFSSGGKFSNYGENFGVGDTIVCAIDLESKPLASIGFSKNGKWLGTAKQFDAGPKGLGVVDTPMKKLQWESVLFPHVLLKNVVVQVQFSVEEGLIPEEGYKPWASALEDGNAIMGPTISNLRDCEVMMMVGLPACGKTTWAEKWVKEHTEKRYVLLGTNLALDQMKVPGLSRKQNYGERFDRLMSRANTIFDTLLSRAVRTPRNYVIDQTNVYKSARKRKLRPFMHFCKVAVVVFPKPEDLKFRADKRFREMGKQVPKEAVDNMLANYVLPVSKDMPHSDEFFDQVLFVELDRGESQRYLDEMKRALGSNLKSDYSLYSRESSVESYTRPSMQNQGASSVSGGHWQSPQLPPCPSNYGYQIPIQVNSAYQEAGSYQRYQNPPVPRAPAPYGSDLSYGRGSVLGDNTSYSGSCGAIPVGRTDFSQSYGVNYPYSRPNIGGNIVEPSPVGSAMTSTFTQQVNVAGGPQAYLQAPRAPTSLPSPLPSPYGSPYGTSPLYGNIPADPQQSGGNAPTHPRYY